MKITKISQFISEKNRFFFLSCWYFLKFSCYSFPDASPPTPPSLRLAYPRHFLGAQAREDRESRHAQFYFPRFSVWRASVDFTSFVAFACTALGRKKNSNDSKKPPPTDQHVHQSKPPILRLQNDHQSKLVVG